MSTHGTHGRTLRWVTAVRRASTIALAVCVLVSLVALWPAGAAEGEGGGGAGDRPLLFQGVAGAAGISVAINTEPRLLPLEDFIRGDAPQADSEWSSNGLAQARAASYYPGSSGTGGPGLMCTFGFPCQPISDATGQPFPPPYPLMAIAQYPTKPDDQTQDGIAQAHAHEAEVWSQASGSTNANTGSPLAPLAPVMTIGSAESRTHQGFEDGFFVVRAESHLKDVALGDGTVRFASIDSVSISKANGDDPSQTDTTFTVSGATVGGTPAKVNEKGIVIDEQQVGGEQLQQANEQLSQFLNEHGASMRVIQPTTTQDGRTSSGHAQGLLVEMAVPVENATGQDLPSVPLPPQVPAPGDPNVVFRTYTTTFVFGQAGSQAFASNNPLDAGLIGGGDLGALPGSTANTEVPTNTGTGGGVPASSSSFSSGTANAPATTGGSATGPSTQQPQVAAPAAGGDGGNLAGLPDSVLRVLGMDRGSNWTINPFLLPIAVLMFTLTRVAAGMARNRLVQQEP